MFRWQRRRHPDVGEHYEIAIFGNVVRIGQIDGEVVFSSKPIPPKDFRPQLEHYLALNHDLEQTYAALGSEPDGVMPCLIDRHRGLRILRQEPWECLASFICTARTKIEKTRQLVEGMASQFGNRINGSDHHAFPSPAVLARAGSAPLEHLFEELLSVEEAGKAAEFAKRVAETAATVVDWRIDLWGTELKLDLSRLHDYPYEFAFAFIDRLSGVGPKVGDCTLLFSCGKNEAFPVDTHVRQALMRWYDIDGDDDVLREWGRERFGPHAGYASQYLFYDRRKVRDPHLP